MEEETKLNKVIELRKAITVQYCLTPEQLRYVNKIERNQLNLNTIKSKRQELPNYMNPSEVYVFMKTAYEMGTEYGLLCEFLILTGLRINEARNLRTSDIEWSNDQIKVVNGKGGKDRYVPLNTQLANKIRMYLDGRRNGYLFCRVRKHQAIGNPMSKRLLQTRVEKVIKACKFEKHLSTHSLRHTFACMCLSKGMSLESIQLMMGHSSRVTTEIYAKLELGQVKQQFLQLTGAL